LNTIFVWATIQWTIWVKFSHINIYDTRNDDFQLI